jgi:hypothetical protein
VKTKASVSAVAAVIAAILARGRWRYTAMAHVGARPTRDTEQARTMLEVVVRLDRGQPVVEGEKQRTVKRLENHQHRVGVGRVQQLLGGGQLGFEVLEVYLGQVFRARFVVVQPAALGHLRAPALQIGRLARDDHEVLDHSFVQLHVLAVVRLVAVGGCSEASGKDALEARVICFLRV